MGEENNTPPGNGEMPPGTGTPPATGTLEADETSVAKTSKRSTSVSINLEDYTQEIENLKSALAKANKEAKDHRLKANELDKLKADAEAAKLSETEKLQKQLATLQTQYNDVLQAAQTRTVNYEVRLQAAQMGIVDPDAAAKLLDWSEIEYAEDGSSPKNVKPLLKKLLEAKPYLAGKAVPPTSGGATNPPRSQTNRQELTWTIISKMTAQEYESRRAEIQQFMMDHPAQFGQRLK